MSDEKVATPNRLVTSLEFFRSRNFYIYLACLGLASFFWLLNALTKTYTTAIDLPIRYNNLPVDEVFVSELPKKAKIEVESFGFNILAYKFSHVGDSIDLDAQKARKSRRALNHIYAISTTPAIESLLSVVPPEIRLKRLLLDTIYFETQKLVEKRLRVVPQLNLDFDAQHMQENDITVKPEYVKVTGAVSALDTLLEMRLKPLKLSGLNNDISLEVDFVKHEGVNIFADKAIVYIPVDQMTEKKMELRIDVKNLPDSLKMRLFPNSVQAVIQMPVSRYNDLGEGDFSFAVDYSEIQNSKHGLVVSPDKIARFCRLSTFEPRKVEFVLSK